MMLISLALSARDYAFENGCWYHRFHKGSYHFPNDDLEQERGYDTCSDDKLLPGYPSSEAGYGEPEERVSRKNVSRSALESPLSPQRIASSRLYRREFHPFQSYSTITGMPMT
jgi:hypothetical protein